MRGTKVMPSTLYKFPTTPHLVWLGQTPVRDDKVLDSAGAEGFLSGSVVIEEKIDGANLGISAGADGDIWFQNRGNWLVGKLIGQWEPLRGWLVRHEGLLRQHLRPGHVLFGEWCYARHCVGYDRLPDWFIAFDVFDVREGRFWSVERRDALVDKLGMAAVPCLAQGRLSMRDVLTLVDGPSAFGPSAREGIYLRREEGPWLKCRAKVVRPEFIQALGVHWASQRLVGNKVHPAHHLKI